MKLEFQSRWLRVLVEFLPLWREIRRYRVAPGSGQERTGRRLQKQIARRLKHATEEAP